MASRSDERLARRPLRLTLMLWMLGVFTLIQATLGLVVYLYLEHTARDQFVDSLEEHLGGVVRDLRDVAPPWSAAYLSGKSPQPGTPAARERTSVAILDGGSGLIGISDPELFDPRAPQVRRAIEGGRSRLRIASSPAREGVADAGELQIVTARLRAGGEAYVVVLAATSRAVRRQLAVIRQTLIIGMPIGLLAAGVAGWYIAGVAVAPIEHVTVMARRISPESVGKPLELEASTSEMAGLRSALGEALERLDRGYRAQERFLSNVSHELKTPIAVVLTEAQALRMDRSLPERAMSFAQSTEEEMRRLGRLVESFLMLTRVRDAELPTMRLRCEVNDLVLDSIRDCRGYAQEHSVTLEPTLLGEDDLGRVIIGDPDLLRTMIDNLIRNAIRFSPMHSPVEVVAEKNDGRVGIHVRDHGPGIDDSIIDHVFDRFAQAPDEQRRGRGSGLGLEIAQGIAELHAGMIRVENLQTGGCRFTATLPLADGFDHAGGAS